MTSITWPGANGAAFDSTFWTTRTIASGGGGGTDTFQIQSSNGRIGCVAAGGSTQQTKYTNAAGAHTVSIDYRGKITWSAVGGDVTVFCVRSDNVAYGGATSESANCYVFEFDTTASTVQAYKVTSSTPAAISGAPAAAAFTYVAATMYEVHLSLVNYTLSATIWAQGTAEPGTPKWTYTDPSNSILNTTSGKFSWGNAHVPATTTNIDIGPGSFTTNFDANPTVTTARRVFA